MQAETRKYLRYPCGVPGCEKARAMQDDRQLPTCINHTIFGDGIVPLYYGMKCPGPECARWVQYGPPAYGYCHDCVVKYKLTTDY